MARIDWVRQRLIRWAAWRSRRDIGGQGYPTQAAFTRLAVDGGGFRPGASVNVDDAEDVLTDKAVQSLRADKPHLHRTVELVYLEDSGIRRAAVALCCAESTVKARLEQIDHDVATWLRNHAQDREQAAGSFTP